MRELAFVLCEIAWTHAIDPAIHSPCKWYVQWVWVLPGSSDLVNLPQIPGIRKNGASILEGTAEALQLIEPSAHPNELAVCISKDTRGSTSRAAIGF